MVGSNSRGTVYCPGPGVANKSPPSFEVVSVELVAVFLSFEKRGAIGNLKPDELEVIAGKAAEEPVLVAGSGAGGNRLSRPNGPPVTVLRASALFGISQFLVRHSSAFPRCGAIVMSPPLTGALPIVVGSYPEEGKFFDDNDFHVLSFFFVLSIFPGENIDDSNWIFGTAVCCASS